MNKLFTQLYDPKFRTANLELFEKNIHTFHSDIVNLKFQFFKLG